MSDTSTSKAIESRAKSRLQTKLVRMAKNVCIYNSSEHLLRWRTLDRELKSPSGKAMLTPLSTNRVPHTTLMYRCKNMNLCHPKKRIECCSVGVQPNCLGSARTKQQQCTSKVMKMAACMRLGQLSK